MFVFIEPMGISMFEPSPGGVSQLRGSLQRFELAPLQVDVGGVFTVWIMLVPGTAPPS
jgi:hypothetical protein